MTADEIVSLEDTTGEVQPEHIFIYARRAEFKVKLVYWWQR